MTSPAPRERALRLYGSAAADGQAALPWSWVEHQLTQAGTYWVVANSRGHPHPRPVWGVWLDNQLAVSVGSPALRRDLADDDAVAVHLDSGLDVVIVEGRASSVGPTRPSVLRAYDTKYDWQYDADRYGPLLHIAPSKVLAWRVGGPAGRDSFQASGCWTFTAGPV